MKSPITSHVLDTSVGRPAAGVNITLEVMQTAWTLLGRSTTNDDGRAGTLLPADHVLQPGLYRLLFDTGAYFSGRGVETFFPHVTVEFEIRTPESHYHVPLLLSPHGFTTYRGS